MNSNVSLIAQRLAFYLTIAPKSAIRQILLMCMRSKPLVPSVAFVRHFY